MIGFNDREPMCKDVIVKKCLECPFCVDEYVGGDYQFNCYAPKNIPEDSRVAPIPDDIDGVMENCPLKKRHVRIMLEGYPPEDEWV